MLCGYVLIFAPGMIALRAADGMPLDGLPQALGSRPAPVQVEALVNDHRVERGKPFTVRVQVTVEPGFHINSDHPKDKYLIPTQVLMKAGPGFTYKAARFPAGVDRSFAFSTSKLSVFEGEIESTVPGLTTRTVSLGRKTLSGNVRYQACDNNTCYPPRNIPFEVPVDVVQ